MNELLEQQSSLNENITQVTRDQLSPFFLPGDHYRLVFVDGIFAQEHSLLPSHSIFILQNLSAALIHHKETLQQELQEVNHLSEGVFIQVPADCQVDKIIHLLFVTTESAIDKSLSYHNLIMLAPHAGLTLFEDHRSLIDVRYMTNTMTKFLLASDAKIDYTKLQHQSLHSSHVANTIFIQQQSSEVRSQVFHLGAQLAKEDQQSFLKAPLATSYLGGLYLPFFQQDIDVNTFIHHQADHTKSEAYYRGVVHGKSRGGFKGKIHVTENVRHVVADLQNRNLLLSKEGEVHTKPELEIYSDEVKCRHGATVGKIDDDMLFYLQSRGISHSDAYHLLLLAFVQAQLNNVSHPAVADKIKNHVTHQCRDIS